LTVLLSRDKAGTRRESKVFAPTFLDIDDCEPNR
jgi:hypothetical protein